MLLILMVCSIQVQCGLTSGFGGWCCLARHRADGVVRLAHAENFIYVLFYLATTKDVHGLRGSGIGTGPWLEPRPRADRRSENTYAVSVSPVSAG